MIRREAILAVAVSLLLRTPLLCAQAKPLGSVSAGWTYLYADQGANQRADLNGWFFKPQFNLGKGYAAFADFTNYYGANSKGGVNSHGATFGVQKNLFQHARLRPGVFVEAGDIRTSSAGSIVHQFAFNAGFNLLIPINKRIGFVVTPAEWVFLYPKGDPRNDFNAKAGFSFSF